MLRTLKLLTIISEGALSCTLLFLICALVLVGSTLLTLPKILNVANAVQGIATAAAIIIPAAGGSWWVFRRLSPYYSQREAKAAAFVFAIAAPAALGIAIVCSPVIASYAGSLLEVFLVLVATFLGMTIVIALIIFVPTVLVLWMVRRPERIDQGRRV